MADIDQLVSPMCKTLYVVHATDTVKILAAMDCKDVSTLKIEKFDEDLF